MLGMRLVKHYQQIYPKVSVQTESTTLERIREVLSSQNSKKVQARMG